MAEITLQKGSVPEGPENVVLEGTEKTSLIQHEEISSSIHVFMTLHLTLCSMFPRALQAPPPLVPNTILRSVFILACTRGANIWGSCETIFSYL